MRWWLPVVATVMTAPLAASADPDVPAEPAAKAAKPKAEVIKVEPNEFTNDPIVGQAKRINGEEVRGLIAFTFDDGPNAETTDAILDALKKYDIPATFFVVTQRLRGKHGEKPRALLAREMEEGHLVASHSVTHAYLGKATGKLLDKEMDASFKALSQEAKRPIGLFRAPFGAMSPAGRVRLKKLGVTEAFWSIDTLDWQAKNADMLRAKAAKMIAAQKGGVILWHDVKEITAKIIGDVFDDLEASNCKALADNKEPIWPVSIHYFLRDGKKAREVPEDVKKRTEAYKAALPGRCAKRPPPPAIEGKQEASASTAAQKAEPKPADKKPTPPATSTPKPTDKKPILWDAACENNPLAKGCN
jgi:peptidoglycan/xylan/chitin deacetylase (PgdA/CDA1 family)